MFRISGKLEGGWHFSMNLFLNRLETLYFLKGQNKAGSLWRICNCLGETCEKSRSGLHRNYISPSSKKHCFFCVSV